jgi:predicted Zn-dependent protease
MLSLVAIRPLVAGSAKPSAQAPTGYAADVAAAPADARAAALAAPSTAAERSVPAQPAAPTDAPAKRDVPDEPLVPAEPAAAAAEPAKAEVPSEPPAALTQRSVRALERGKRDEAIELAARSIAADPTDALPYLVHGSALMEKGDAKAARVVFDACVTHAKKGAVYECAAMGGRKQR